MGGWILLLTLWAQAPEMPDQEVTLLMHERFAYATMMRTSLIHGFLDRATRHAGQLEATLDEKASAALTEAVAAAARATTIDTAAAAAARIANACGDCHEENRVSVVVLGDSPVSWTDTLQARMGRHIWAADRMWVGLVGHHEPAWSRGAQLLVDDPFLSHRKELQLSIEQMDGLEALAREGTAATTWDDRADVYGRFLASCAACHDSAMGR